MQPNNFDEIFPLIHKIPWIKPLIYVVTKDNAEQILFMICSCLAVNQKYASVLQSIMRTNIVKYHIECQPYLQRIACNMIVETSYLDINSVTSMWLPSRMFFTDLSVDILRQKPTISTLQMIKKYFVTEFQFHHVRVNLLTIALKAKNEELILAICESLNMESFYVDNSALRSLCEMKNIHLIEKIAQTMSPLEQHNFFRDVVWGFASTNNFELFRLYYDKNQLSEESAQMIMGQSISRGCIEIVTFCMKTFQVEIDEIIMCTAYRSGKREMVNLIKSVEGGESVDMDAVAKRYFNFLSGNFSITFNPELLRELLSVCAARLSSSVIGKFILNLICDYRERYENVDDEIFRIFAEYEPDLTIVIDNKPLNTSRMLLCLKYFKKIQAPSHLKLSQQQLEEIITSGDLNPNQLPESFSPLIHVDWKESIIKLVDIKRIVYLFFSTETELRDNAELILEYL